MKATPYHPFTSLDFVLQAQTRIIAAEVYVISNAVETALSLISDPFVNTFQAIALSVLAFSSLLPTRLKGSPRPATPIPIMVL